LQNSRDREPFNILHLATHADFRPGAPKNSYIQLWDRQLSIGQLKELDWVEPSLELLVLSACRTALGSREAELGFTGLAIQAGVKSAVGSLWYVSDNATLGLMASLYSSLPKSSTKAEALQQAQLAMLRGEAKIVGRYLVTPSSTFPLPENLQLAEDTDFSDPFFWGAFVLVGNPW